MAKLNLLLLLCFLMHNPNSFASSTEPEEMNPLEKVLYTEIQKHLTALKSRMKRGKIAENDEENYSETYARDLHRAIKGAKKLQLQEGSRVHKVIYNGEITLKAYQKLLETSFIEQRPINKPKFLPPSLNLSGRVLCHCEEAIDPGLLAPRARDHHHREG